MIEYRELMEATGYSFWSLDKVYHSNTMHEMQINADLENIDICNPYVLMFLAKQTTYHHAFWKHTAKRFTAFKNILRKNKDVRKSLRDGRFLHMLEHHFDAMNETMKSSMVFNTSGRKQEYKNMKQVIDIVKKAIEDSVDET